MGETNSVSVAHVGYDISPLSRVKFNSLEWRNIQYAGKGTRHFNSLEDYRFFHHWLSRVKMP
jgi:hypothetical protein